MHRKKYSKGITLILALLIMSAVVAIGITVSTIVVQQVRLNSVATDAHQGYYATESGLEQGLYLTSTLKKETLTYAITQLQNARLPAGADTSLFPNNYNNVSFLSQSAPSDSAQTATNELKEGQSVMIELYNVDDTLYTLGASPTMNVYGTHSGTGVGILEVSWVAWTDNTDFRISKVQRILVSESLFSIAGGQAIPLGQFYPTFNGTFAGYRIRVTLLRTRENDGVVNNFSVTTTPATPSQIQLKSVASLRNNTQALVALFPWSLPLSSIFDFVIYSEQKLKKDQPITIAEDVKTYGPFDVPVSTNPEDVPATPNDPFTTTVCTECSYYVRIIGDGVNPLPGLTLSMTNAGATVSSGNLTLASKTPFTSCITPVPFETFTGASSPRQQISFSDITGLTNFTYQLLTQPTFLGPEETFCPTP